MTVTAPLASSGTSLVSAGASTTGRLLDSLRWLIRLRWVAFVGVTLTVAAAAAAGTVSSVGPLVVVVVVLAGCNSVFLWRAGRLTDETPPGQVTREIEVQIVVDLMVLTAVLRWSGGVDNPFVAFYVFHAALAAMLLPLRRALLIGCFAIALHGFELVGTAAGWFPHVPVLFGASHLHEALHEEASWRSGLFITGYLGAFTGTQFGVIYFVGTIARRHREAESRRLEHERVARSRERLARIGTVAGGVAHAVRNPLHGLVNCIDILRRGGADAEILELMDEGLQRIERITQRLLVLGRDEPLRPTPTDLGELADDAMRLARVAARECGVGLELEVEGGPLIALVDPDRLSEAIVNLIDNSVHASPDGATVTVRLTRVGATAVLEVADRGPGMTPEVCARAFDPFFTTKAVGEGTGLGLAITRKLVEDHGGDITLGDRAGGGAAVRLVLPIDGPVVATRVA